jgi:hypothetical protein
MRLPFFPQLLVFISLFAASGLSAQARLNLFIDCKCNKTLLKQEINYVNHALDPANAQINLFIVTSSQSNGSKVFNLNFKGQHELEGNQLVFKLPVTTVMTGREIDEALTKRIKLGLAGFLAGTPYADLADVIVETPGEEAIAGEEAALEDNWNNWIFEVNARFNTNKESRRGRTDLRLGFEADRTTPELRIRFAPNYFYRKQMITQSDGSILTSFRQDMWMNASIVKSISDHWSVGFFNSMSSTTFRNIDYGIWIAPAIEYNFFNYNEVPFKEFTVAYRLGWTHNDYSEETIFLKTEESLMRQVLDADLRLRQRWGQIFAGVSAGNYLNDFSKNRVSLSGRANVRLIKGLSFNVGGSYEIINDQISLPRGEASVEDILLGQSQLATNFEADLSFGLSYTFGSLYNNVINTRL